ncbi:MAG: dicarboxylate/amino acid:cation symporter [Chlamydiae bacterium]|nr:dicarboxylate/amino acid:cation symporter [Chlamydiota bacterium]
MPFILVFLILLVASLQKFIPVSFLATCYALSLTLKSVIIFLLPLVIFMLLFKTTASLSSKATKIVLFLLIGICLSNFISTLISYVVGSGIYHLNLSINLPKDQVGLLPSFSYEFPKLIANDFAMFSGLFSGIVLSLLHKELAQKISSFFDRWIEGILKFILVLIPPFIIGFMMKLIHDKVIENIILDYALIFLLVALAQYAYIFSLYLIANNFKLRSFLSSIKNMFPAAITGFGSMSSAAALPLTLIGAEKNTNSSPLTKLVIPTTVNIHLIGDCFAIPIFAFAIMKSFGALEPTFLSYLTFASYFVLAKFSVAAIPGGGIIVMLPILEAHLGFTAEMSSLITALYILFDPIITTANISGNGSFAMIIHKISSLQFFKQSFIIKKS